MSTIYYWFFFAALVSLPAASRDAAAIAAPQGFSMLKRMQARDYFESPNQIELAKAIEREDVERMQRAITAGANVDELGKDEMRPLFWALTKKKLTAFKFLLDHGADTNPLMHVEDSGRNRTVGAMEMAVMMESPEYLRALLDHRADPNTKINESETLIFRAVKQHRLENIKLLVERGADINHQDGSGKTALATAVNIDLYEIALFLLRAGADPTISTNWGFSPIDKINKFGHRTMLRNSSERAAHMEFIAELKRRGLLN